MPLPPDEPNEEERLEKLPEDGQTPFSPASSSRDSALGLEDERQAKARSLDTTHPATDSNIEAEEVYDEGVSDAAEASEPNAGNTVIGYDEAHNKSTEGKDTRS